MTCKDNEKENIIRTTDINLFQKDLFQNHLRLMCAFLVDVDYD